MTPHILAIANQKGGVGKTSTTLALAHNLAQDGRVLVIDTDPQGNATDILDADISAESITLHDVLAAVMDRSVDTGAITNAITPASPAWSGIDVVPGTRALAGLEAITTIGREAALRTALDGATHDYSHVLIDCPPALGVLTVGALVTADAVLAITEARASSVAGLAELMDTITLTQTHYNPHLSLAGIAVNRYRPDRQDTTAWRQVLTDTYADLILGEIPERDIVAKAATNRVPVPASERAGRDYTAAIHHLATRLLPHH
ncbi:ParA family protein [Actinomyces oricola]|uniref:ParA family protein n=1 Tax=Actinomyces oricola TaxID=206043 RepID=UPI000FFEA9B5|nr:AAA family ATPase [Actinomyces oricola]